MASLPEPAASSDDAVEVLVAEDDRTSQLLLTAMLERHGYRVTAVDNGRSAVEASREKHFDIVLLDISMPVLDGYEAAAQIKRDAGERFLPIIFLTAITDENALARCVASGGDDFLTKPYSSTILQAKLEALLRTRELYQTVMHQRNELARHQERIRREHGVAERVLGSLVNRVPEVAGLRRYLRPTTEFNGDVVLAASTPAGGLNLLVGDFTGHGLSAAVGSIPLAETFYRMSNQGYPIPFILNRVNRQLREMLPTDIFCAAAALHLDRSHQRLQVWNGGLPDLVVVSRYGHVRHRIPSSHLPLGIAEDSMFESRPTIIDVNQDDRVYLYTDGLTDLQDAAGTALGTLRLERLLEGEGDAFERVSGHIEKVADEREPIDDITLVELSCGAQVEGKRRAEAVPAEGGEWLVVFELGAMALRQADPVPLLLGAIDDLQGLGEHRSDVGTILSELFNNALEHGLLRLDTGQKDSAEGFLRYYEQRERSLHDLTDGCIRVEFRHRPIDSGGELLITVTDSGPGFDTAATLGAAPGRFGGRGLQVVTALCERLDFAEGGRRVEACYRWHLRRVDDAG